MDSEYLKTITKNNKNPNYKKFLQCDTYPKINSTNTLSILLNSGKSEDVIKVNNLIVKKKMMELTLNFLEPLYLYFNKQFNDLKIFDFKDFQKILQQKDLQIKTHFKSNSDMISFYKEFSQTLNFKFYLESNFNIFIKK